MAPPFYSCPKIQDADCSPVLPVNDPNCSGCDYIHPAYVFFSWSEIHSAYGETLSTELGPFNIRVTVITPGTFRTSAPFNLFRPAGTPIPDYASTRDGMKEAQELRMEKLQKADPERGMDVVVDLVLGQGRAGELTRLDGDGSGDGSGAGGDVSDGRGKWPLWLFLGKDGMDDLRNRITKMAGTMDEWKDVGSDVGLD